MTTGAYLGCNIFWKSYNYYLQLFSQIIFSLWSPLKNAQNELLLARKLIFDWNMKYLAHKIMFDKMWNICLTNLFCVYSSFSVWWYYVCEFMEMKTIFCIFIFRTNFPSDIKRYFPSETKRYFPSETKTYFPSEIKIYIFRQKQRHIFHQKQRDIFHQK